MKLKNFVLCILSFYCLAVVSQKKETDNTVNKEIPQIFSYDSQVSNFLQLEQASGAFTEAFSMNLEEANNVAIIEQIGNDNFIQANNFAGTSRLLYSQNGNRNGIRNQNNLDAVVTQRVIQVGNDNKINAISSGDLDIIQTGNGIIYEQIGTNALTNSMQLRLEGNARTVSIRTISVSNGN